MFGALKRGFRSLASLILVRNVVGELRLKRTLAASRGFLASARLSCLNLLINRNLGQTRHACSSSAISRYDTIRTWTKNLSLAINLILVARNEKIKEETKTNTLQ